MKTEQDDDVTFLITGREEQHRLERAWAENGGTTENVGGGIVLFYADAQQTSVVLRTRETQQN